MRHFYVSLLALFPIGILAQNFSEVALSAGINHTFAQFSSMGGGAVFADFDNDGWEDLYLSGGQNPDKIYMNQQDGTFSDASSSSGITAITQNDFTVGAIAADFNKDGFRDLFLITWYDLNTSNTNLRRNKLLLNNGSGVFSEAMSSSFPQSRFSMAAAVLDANNDGFLDIYVGNYVETPAFLSDGNGQTTGYNHDCFADQLYISNAGTSFTESGASYGVANEGCTLAVMSTDYDQDNDMDLMVANDFGEFIIPNKLYQNNGNGFTDVSASTAADAQMYAMGISSADIDKDGDFDYYITNLGRNRLLQNNSGIFSDITASAGVENTYTPDGNGMELLTTGWGTALVDVNNDTWPDLVVANGRVPAFPFNQTGETDANKLYMNNGNSTFADASATAGIGDTNRARGMAFSDYDKDGDLDFVFVVQDESASTSARTLFYRNNLNPNGLTNANYIQFILQGTTTNTDGVGAKIKVTANGETLVQEVHGGGTHAGMHSNMLHFGLATATDIDQVEVIWPNGLSQVFTDAQINNRYRIVQGQANLATNEVLRTKGLSVFPNPTQTSFSIKGLEQATRVQLINAVGQIVREQELAPNKKMDIRGLEKGVYRVQFSIQGKMQRHALLIK